MIISYVQTKGGTGKSTLALNTAFSKTIRKKFQSIALLELDPQGTLKNWWNEREKLENNKDKISFHHISSSQKEIFHEGIKNIAAINQFIIMDIPGESIGKLHTRIACALSDLVVIPMRTSTNDETAFADNLYPIIKEIIKIAPEKKNSFYILPSFTHPQSKKEKYIEYFKDILPPDIFCFDVLYTYRSIYENFNRDGLNLYEYLTLVKNNKKISEQVKKAIKDVEEISKAILNNLEVNNGSSKKEEKD